jgi:hypothetical protein
VSARALLIPLLDGDIALCIDEGSAGRDDAPPPSAGPGGRGPVLSATLSAVSTTVTSAGESDADAHITTALAHGAAAAAAAMAAIGAGAAAGLGTSAAAARGGSAGAGRASGGASRLVWAGAASKLLRARIAFTGVRSAKSGVDIARTQVRLCGSMGVCAI